MPDPETPPAEPTPSEPQGEEKDPAWYRDQLAKKDAEMQKLQEAVNQQRVRMMEKAFEDVGLDPTKGIGKAVAENPKLEKLEPTAEEVRTFAIEEYQWEPPPDQQPNPLSQPTNDAQQRVNQTVQEAGAVPTTQIDFDIAEAEKAGNFAAAMALKVAKYRTEVLGK